MNAINRNILWLAFLGALTLGASSAQSSEIINKDLQVLNELFSVSMTRYDLGNILYYSVPELDRDIMLGTEERTGRFSVLTALVYFAEVETVSELVEAFEHDVAKLKFAERELDTGTFYDGLAQALVARRDFDLILEVMRHNDRSEAAIASLVRYLSYHFLAANDLDALQYFNGQPSFEKHINTQEIDSLMLTIVSRIIINKDKPRKLDRANLVLENFIKYYSTYQTLSDREDWLRSPGFTLDVYTALIETARNNFAEDATTTRERRELRDSFLAPALKRVHHDHKSGPSVRRIRFSGGDLLEERNLLCKVKGGKITSRVLSSIYLREKQGRALNSDQAKALIAHAQEAAKVGSKRDREPVAPEQPSQVVAQPLVQAVVEVAQPIVRKKPRVRALEVKTGSTLANVVAKSPRDEMVLLGLKCAPNPSLCTVNDEAFPTALLMAHLGRLGLLQKFILQNKEGCGLNDAFDGFTVRECVIETLLHKRKVSELIQLLKMPEFIDSALAKEIAHSGFVREVNARNYPEAILWMQSNLFKLNEGEFAYTSESAEREALE